MSTDLKLLGTDVWYAIHYRCAMGANADTTRFHQARVADRERYFADLRAEHSAYGGVIEEFPDAAAYHDAKTNHEKRGIR